MAKKRILSGTRPTGFLHLGNYLGCLKNWRNLQDDYECFFMVADWHALTTEYADPSNMPDYIREMVIDWLAIGLDPKKSTMFIQSHVLEHAELNLLLGMMTPVSWLERCPTYKEQIQQISNKDLSNVGFLNYPVLQAADIIIYKAEVVPVGEDQLPHIEMTREIVRRFNFLYGNVFPEPLDMLSPVPKLLGTDGRKMSKSYNNCIYLSDTADVVETKVMQMVTDPARVRKTDKGHPDVCSVYSYHKIFTKDKVAQIECDCIDAAIGCRDCKKILADNINKEFAPAHEYRKNLNMDFVKDVISEGTKKARKVAEKTMSEVRDAMKLTSFKK